jgi:hypothetical protein
MCVYIYICIRKNTPKKSKNTEDQISSLLDAIKEIKWANLSTQAPGDQVGKMMIQTENMGI